MNDEQLWNAYAQGREDEAEERMTRARQMRARSVTAWLPILLGVGVWWLFA